MTGCVCHLNQVSMRKAFASFLLVCLGVLIPVAAVPMRVCLLGGGILTSGFASHQPECCTDCERDAGEPGSCCVELEKLPDLLAPQPPLEVVAAVLAEIPAWDYLAPLDNVLPCALALRSEPVRGPTSPAAHRAVLGIWRL